MTDPIPSSKDDFFADTRMPLGDHLQELRARLLKSLYGLALAFVVCLFFAGDLLAFLAQPLLLALHLAGQKPQLYIASLPEAFITYVKVALYAACFLASPWIFYQLWQFIAAGLYPREKHGVRFFVPFSAGLFILGGLFFIMIIAPLSCAFFISFAAKIDTPHIADNFLTRILMKTDAPPDTPTPDDDHQQTAPQTDPHTLIPTDEPLVAPLFTLQKYVTLILLLALAFSFTFQTPLVVFFLGWLHLVDTSTLCKIRKYVFFAIVIFAAVITPPDVISQMALALPMYALYELGILLLKLHPPNHRESAEDI